MYKCCQVCRDLCNKIKTWFSYQNLVQKLDKFAYTTFVRPPQQPAKNWKEIPIENERNFSQQHEITSRYLINCIIKRNFYRWQAKLCRQMWEKKYEKQKWVSSALLEWEWRARKMKYSGYSGTCNMYINTFKNVCF